MKFKVIPCCKVPYTCGSNSGLVSHYLISYLSWSYPGVSTTIVSCCNSYYSSVDTWSVSPKRILTMDANSLSKSFLIYSWVVWSGSCNKSKLSLFVYSWRHMGQVWSLFLQSSMQDSQYAWKQPRTFSIWLSRQMQHRFASFESTLATASSLSTFFSSS